MLKVSLWRKSLFCAVCGGVALFAIYIGITSLGREEKIPLCALSVGWLLILVLVGGEIVRQCSSTVDDDSIRQVAFFSAGKVIAVQRLQWCNIKKVSFKNGTFVLDGLDCCVKIKVFMLGDPREVIPFISKRLPKELVNYPVGP